MKNTLFALLASASALWAGSYTYLGDTTGKPVWNRPVQNGSAPPVSLSSVGTAVPYEAVAFKVSQFGTYSFLCTATVPTDWDDFAVLYAGQFDASQPLQNSRRAADATEVTGVVSFDYDLNPGAPYYFVTTGFMNADYGQYQLTISGPGSITPVPPDTDGDGMPDDWETAHGTNPLVPDGEADPDGDGYSNYQEYQANTEPLIAASHLQLSVTRTPSSPVALVFLAAPERYHRVLWRDAASTGNWSTLTNFPPASGSTPVPLQVPLPAVGALRFYRLEAGLEGG